MSIKTLNRRLNFRGGNAEGRLIKSKEDSLRAALYSYQAAIAVKADGREFKCLINPDKTKPDYDNKILSILYKEPCLNSNSSVEQLTDFHCGEVFLWKETNTHWLVYLENLEEDAYFRAEIRRCDQSIMLDDREYWVYLRGPMETSITWNQKSGIEWNDLNFSQVMYITKDEYTEGFFHRFKTLKIGSPAKTWQVVGENVYYADGIIQVFLDEYFENTVQDAAESEAAELAPAGNTQTVYIDGPTTVQPYSKVSYSVVGRNAGEWLLDNKSLLVSTQTITLNIANDKKNGFTLTNRYAGSADLTLNVKVSSF